MTLRPAYRITVAGATVDTTREPRASTLVGLRVTADMDAPVDAVTAVLGAVDGLAPASGDAIAVDLGYRDGGEFSRVFTGTVTAVERGLTAVRVTGASPVAALSGARVNEFYQGRSAGQIVRDLAGRAAVRVATVEEGSTFPAYVVDAGRCVYRHLRELADLCGFDVYLDPAGALVFRRFTAGTAVHDLAYGTHLLAAELLERPSAAGRVEAFGEGPGAGHGDTAWAWLTKDFSAAKGSAGPDGEPLLLIERAALRTAAAALTAAQAAYTGLRRRAVRGRLTSTGLPKVRLGDSVRLRGVPGGRPDGQFQVRSVTHRLTKRGGFTTAVEFRAMG